MIKNSAKTIAILMATYNGEKYVEEMLRSLEKQTDQDFICYIHDDGSTDQTMHILREWKQAHPYQYEIIEAESQGSAKDNFLWMLSQVEADYYMFADQDDVWMPDKVEKSFKKMKQTETLCQDAYAPFCVFTDMQVVDEDLHEIAPSFIRYIGRDPYRTSMAEIIMDNPAAGCTMLFNRPLRDLALQLQDSSRIEMHDVWVLALAAAYGVEHIGIVDEACALYRQHDNNEMGARTESRADKIMRNLRDLFSGRFMQQKRAFLQKGRDLAGQMCLVEGLPDRQKKILREFSEIGKLSKWQRIKFYKKYGFTRNQGTVWIYLWV